MKVEIKCAYTELVNPEKLVQNPKNPNKHSDRQIELLAKNIEHHGFRHPIIVSKRSGFIVAGHARLAASLKLGLTEVPIDHQDFENEAAEYLFLVSDNKLAELADHDDAFMIETIKELDLGEMDFELLGMDDFELPNFEPASEDEQGKLDELKIKIMECPHCGQTFEEKQAKIID
jgi:hypothetical protein